MCHIYTSQYSYRGNNRLDITVKGNDPIGKLYAPTWDLLMAVKKKRLSLEAFSHSFYALMRKRYTENPEKFKQILQQDEIVLVCFERPEAGYCHRYIVANILCKLGGEYKGELNIDGTFWGKVDLSKFDEPKK